MNDSISLVKYQLKNEWLLSEAFAVIVEEVASAFDGLAVPVVAIVYTHELAVPPAKFPAAELLGLNSSPNDDSSAQVYRHAIDVLWTVQGRDEDSIVKTVETLILATRRMSYRKVLPMPDGTTCPVIPGVENYGPLIQRHRGQAQPLVKGATIRLTVPTIAG